VKQLPKSVGAGNPHATFCGNRGRATASGDPVTFLTKGLTSLAGEVLRRLSGERTETSAVFNMTTQFGGGKTHSLTLLYHLQTPGPKLEIGRG
jgi:hypothetical protein